MKSQDGEKSCEVRVYTFSLKSMATDRVKAQKKEANITGATEVPDFTVDLNPQNLRKEGKIAKDLWCSG